MTTLCYYIKSVQPPILEELFKDGSKKYIQLSSSDVANFHKLTADQLAHSSSAELGCLCSGGIAGMVDKKTIHYLREFEKLHRTNPSFYQ